MQCWLFISCIVVYFIPLSLIYWNRFAAEFGVKSWKDSILEPKGKNLLQWVEGGISTYNLMYIYAYIISSNGKIKL